MERRVYSRRERAEIMLVAARAAAIVPDAKCREGCGEPADDESGRCRFCNGTEDPPEPSWMQQEAINHTDRSSR